MKPSNVVIDAGFAKVIDLSVARPPGRVGKPVGTRVYMAPKQATGGMLTEATDVSGVGDFGLKLHGSAVSMPIPCPNTSLSSAAGI